MSLQQDIEKLPFLKDIDVFVNYILENKPTLTQSKSLSPKDCFAINEKLHLKKEDAKKTHRQYHYPCIYFLCQVFINSKVLDFERVKSKFYFKTDTERFTQFWEMNAVERYFFIWQTLLIECDFLTIQGRDDYAKNCAIDFYQVLSYFEHIEVSKKNKKLIKSKNKDVEIQVSIHSLNMRWLNFYLIYLGFWKLTFDNKRNGYDFIPETTQITPLGKTLAKILFEERFIGFWNKKEKFFSQENYEYFMELNPETKRIVKTSANDGNFIEAFQDLFPQKILEKQVEPTYQITQKGKYIFQVSLVGMWANPKDKKWWKIAIHSSQTLEDLHLAIQNAIEFDNDHLYAFRFDGSYERTFNDDRGEIPPYAVDYKLEDLYLSKDTNLIYNFDFGDNWEFEVKLMKVDTSFKESCKTELIEQKGKNPVQYPDWNEDEGW